MATTPQPDAPGQTLCPFLGVPTTARRIAAPIDYPSFENRCWSAERPIALLLTDQATLCLCSAHHECPRFLAARAARRGQPPAPAAIPPPELGGPDDINQALKSLSAEVKAGEVAQQRSRRRWGWIGAGLIFMSSLLCGGVFAGYVGWQLVNNDLIATQPGTVDTLSVAAAPAQPQVYLIVTATSAPPAPEQSAPEQPAAAPAVAYPQAVTPTPDGAGVALVGVAQGQAVTTLAQATPAEIAELPQALSSATTAPLAALPDMQLAIPTRRPTPILDIPTSTPAAEIPTATSTATPTPQLGTPVVIFAAQDAALESGECTQVTWHVENVRAVFYENSGVNGHGEKEECLDDDPGDYNLVVILGDGSTRTYTATVDLIVPTNTPLPTPTFTEEAAPTPTWTPSIPTDTPTPPIQYGVRLDVDDDGAVICNRGASCEVEMFVTNSSTVVDNLTVSFGEAGSWSRTLCRLDGVCAADGLTIAAVGPGNTGVLRLRITVPADVEAGAKMTYRLHATSDGSGGKARSEDAAVTVTAQ
jgi:hypothetical protein